MLYPTTDPFKNYWDLYISLILIFSCLITPYRIAFVHIETQQWSVINYYVDICFALDIILIFNSAYFDENYRLVQSRKRIAKEYVRSWFFIDLVAIIPFDLLFMNSSQNDLNKIARITRIGRLYKLVKLMKLVRIIKVLKQKNKMFKSIQSYVSIGVGFERLGSLLFACPLFVHIVACLWVMQT